MHMIDVMKKLQGIAEAGYDNEDIQRGIDAAGKHTVAEAQSPNSKSSDWESLEEEEAQSLAQRAAFVSEKVSNLYPSDPGQDDEGDDEGSNPRLNPDPEIGSKEWYKQKKLKRGEAVSQVMVKGKDGKMYPNPHEASLADQVYDYNVKQGKIQEVHEDEIDEAVVEVPVNELAELMQLAGYTDYAEKIEEYANEPEEDYMDAEEQLIGLSGGLNGPKKMYAAAAGGDNPMDQEPREVTESTFESFYKKYDKFVAELTESEQDK